MTRTVVWLAAVFLLAMEPWLGARQLSPTSHPPVPRSLSRIWLVPHPDRQNRATPLSEAMRLVDAGDHANALVILSTDAPRGGPLADYAVYYAALAEQGLGQVEAARARFSDIGRRQASDYLNESAALGEAAAHEVLGAPEQAVAAYERLAAFKTAEPDQVLMRLATAARLAGDLQRAGEALARIHFEFPLSPLAADAGAQYDALPGVQRIVAGNERYRLELGRAERLHGARRHAEARVAFDRLRPHATGNDRELVALRLAESDFALRRYRSARDLLRPHLDTATRQAEVLYYYAASIRPLGASAEYVRIIRRIVAEFPAEVWAEEALNNLATHFVLADDDAQADVVFRELYDKYPRGRHAERAAWKIGWRAYRARRYADTAEYFDRAARDFPRSDYRPSWLYWSGRAHEALKQPDSAGERFGLVVADYQHSYYGRLAAGRPVGRRPAPDVPGDDASAPLPAVANEATIRALLEIGRYQDALNEVGWARRTWGDSPVLQATSAWASQRLGPSKTGTERFNLVRGGITTMRRAYPQFMSAGGESLPRDVLTVIFPLAYADLISKYSDSNKLDPYLVSALMAQESTFVPDIRSAAGAVGLMQLMPPTARQYARRLKLPYSASLLRNPEANVRMGTAYLADKIAEFGALHLALASYNAGESAVRRWLAERPGDSPEEFIDDIPYPETQNYVKRILGTADDYRRLYRSAFVSAP